MKRIPSAICASIAFLTVSPVVQASDDLVTSFWVGTLKQQGLEPTLLPLLYTSESACEESLKEVNGIAASTVGGKRKPACEEVMINTRQLRAYVHKQNS